MNISALARSLGISRQMVYKSRDQGMPTDSLEAAIAWRKRNVDFFRSKTGRIGGNSGKTYPPLKVAQSHEIERSAIEATLTKIIPNMYFERVDWLAAAMKEIGVMITGEQLMEIQDTLFSTYLEEIVYGHFQIDSHFDLPPLSLMRLDSEERRSVIASLNKILSEEKTL